MMQSKKHQANNSAEKALHGSCELIVTFSGRLALDCTMKTLGKSELNTKFSIGCSRDANENNKLKGKQEAELHPTPAMTKSNNRWCKRPTDRLE